MAKQVQQSEREMRDRMNKIVRDKDGNIISINGKPVVVKSDD